MCTVFFDFNKAFDSVSHIKLLQKLEHYCQYVCVNGSASDEIQVSSGVPRDQGSVLGPPIVYYLH